MPLEQALLVDAEDRDGYHCPGKHREDEAHLIEGEAVLKTAQVLVPIHAEADDQAREHLPERARQVRRRLRVPSFALGLRTRVLHCEAIGGHVGDHVTRRGEDHEDGGDSACLGGPLVARRYLEVVL